MQLFKKKNTKVVTFFFTGGYRTFELTAATVAKIKEILESPTMASTITSIIPEDDNKETIIVWSKVTCVEIEL